LLIAGAWPTVADADHSWSDFHWTRGANPFTVIVGDNLNSPWTDYLATAVSDWSQHPEVLEISLEKGQTASPECVPVEGTVQACHGEYGRNGWLGLASVWNINGHIAQGILQMNDTYFNEPAYNTPEWRNLVVCQELAHTFGLGHQDETQGNPNLGSCMDYSSNPAGPPSNEHPNQHDWDQLMQIYEHLDPALITMATPGAMERIELSELTVDLEQLRFPEAGGVAEVPSLGAGDVELSTFLILADEDILARGAATPEATPSA
jgi:hypothetical protein